MLWRAGVTPAVQGNNAIPRSAACLSIGTAKDSSSIRTPISLQRLSASIHFKARRHNKLDSSIGTIPDTIPESNALKPIEGSHIEYCTPQSPRPAPNEHPCGNEPAVACLCRSSKDGKNVDVILTVNQKCRHEEHLPATRVLFTSPDILLLNGAKTHPAEQSSAAHETSQLPREWTDSELQFAFSNDDATGVPSMYAMVM